MIFTFLLRLCSIIHLCQIENDNIKESYPDTYNLNSFSSKTAYRNSKLIELKNETNNYLDSCNLIQMNTIFRHGTRFPSSKDMDKMEAVHRKIIKSQAHSILPVEFQNWKMPFIRSKEKELASVGYEEMMLLGHRFRQRFINHIYPKPQNFKNIQVFSSSLSRSKLSAVTFLRTFLNDSRNLKEVTKLVTENDQYLRFFDNCPHYTKSVVKNKASKMECNKYTNGPEIKRVIRDIQQKWKLTDVSFTPEDVRVLYIMCGYEIATNLSSFMRPHVCPMSPAGDGLVVCPLLHKHATFESSPLCSLLNSDQYAVLEYIYDLKHYWVKAYGNEVTWLQSCGLMSPILDQIMTAARGHQNALKTSSTSKRSLDHLLNQETYNRGLFWFGHAETLLPIISLLGLFNQTTPVTSKTFSERLSLLKDHKQRFSTFRTSNIVPFSGNLGLDLYHCPKLSHDNLSGYRLQVKVNEKAVAWPLANGHSHMSIELFLKLMKLCQADKYDHDAICVRGLSSTEINEVHKRSDELSSMQ